VLHARNRLFQAAIPDRSVRDCDAIIAFDTSAWLLAQRARDFRRPFLLDRSIACASAVRALLADVHRKYPEWLPPPGTRDQDLLAAERQEHALAARIVVGSSFVRSTLVAEGVDAAKVRINPYGVDWARFAGAALEPGPPPEPHRSLRFLFVGSVTGRKGVPILLEAWRRLAPRSAELWLAGPCGPHERALIRALPGLRVLGGIPHASIPQLCAQTDVFVLPSLLEGFALVLLEALASGLAIIATPNTGSADLLTSSPDLGRSIEPGSVESLLAAMDWYLAHPPVRTQIVATAAPLATRYSWESYGDRWAELLREDLSLCS
jgi:glycosyltransferase involved in cell wall biosynthesis